MEERPSVWVCLLFPLSIMQVAHAGQESYGNDVSFPACFIERLKLRCCAVLGLAEMLSVISLHCKIYRVSLCNGNHLMDDFFGMLHETIAHEKFSF